MSPTEGPAAVLCFEVAAASALVWTILAVRLLWGSRRFPRLPDVAAEPPPLGWPTVSVIVPSRNEEQAVEAATRALLAQDYPRLEVVAIDDRSTDATGRVLDAVAAGDERLTVRHVTTLPAGWLGKNNAMAVGAAAATGEWLLFTDADIHFAPDALKRSLAFAHRHGLGHVVALPHLVAPGFLERAFVACFGLFANLVWQVWDLDRPGSRAFVGVGAFNLVRRDAYDSVGGHTTLAFEVVDDAKLGLILRRSGIPQGALDSGGLVTVRWQQGFVASLNGLIKNAFAALEWSVPRTVGFALALVTMTAGPILVGLLSEGLVTRALAAWATVVPMAILGAVARRATSGSGVEGVTLPLSGPLLAGVALASAALALWRQGIVWRGTFYPLADLRRGCVREGDWPRARAVGWPTP